MGFPMIELDRLNEKHVVSHSMINADLGIGGRSLVVISGIALPHWKVDTDTVQRQDCRILLRVPADALEHWSVHVGLASIGNDDTAWGFAVDEATVTIDAAGNLVLNTKLAVMGEWSSLNRFSYQVVATTVTQVHEITGTVKWNKARFTPGAPQPSALEGKISVGLKAYDNDETLLTGEILAVSFVDGDIHAKYRILDPPRGRTLQVIARALNFTLFPGELPTENVAPEPGVENIFTITAEHPSRSDVNFRFRPAFVG